METLQNKTATVQGTEVKESAKAINFSLLRAKQQEKLNANKAPDTTFECMCTNFRVITTKEGRQGIAFKYQVENEWFDAFIAKLDKENKVRPLFERAANYTAGTYIMTQYYMNESLTVGGLDQLIKSETKEDAI